MKTRHLLIAGLILLSAPLRADEGVEDAQGAVYVVKPGRTPLRAAPKLDAPAKGAVAYGQKLALEAKTSTDPKWLKVKVPGDAAEGWLPASATVEKRPSIDSVAIGAAAAKLSANENTTATAIRGLDGRTAAYAKQKELPPEVFDQLSRLEGFGEQLFSDRHSTDAKGGWHYRDGTAPGRIAAAQSFASAEGLVAPKPPAPPPPPAAAK